MLEDLGTVPKMWELGHSFAGSTGAFESLLHPGPTRKLKSSFSTRGFSLAMLVLITDKLEKKDKLKSPKSQSPTDRNSNLQRGRKGKVAGNTTKQNPQSIMHQTIHRHQG